MWLERAYLSIHLTFVFKRQKPRTTLLVHNKARPTLTLKRVNCLGARRQGSQRQTYILRDIEGRAILGVGPVAGREHEHIEILDRRLVLRVAQVQLERTVHLLGQRHVLKGATCVRT